MAEAATSQIRPPARQRKTAQGPISIAVARVSCRLWLGDDHLLQVESSGGYSESYKRFYFRDIQSIILQKTRYWAVWNILLGIFTGALLILVLATIPKGAPSKWSGDEVGGGIFLGFMVLLFGFLLVVNLVKGRTCRSYLKTAVHLEELPSLRRYRNAEKVFARIRPLIESAQGSTAAEMLAPQYAALLASVNARPATPGQFSRLADPAVTAYRGRIHEVLFFALLADTGTDVLNIFLPCMPVVLLGMATGAVATGTLLIALVRQHETDLKPALRVLTWISAVYIGIGYLVGYAVMIIKAPGQQPDATQWGYIKGIADMRPFETPRWLAILAISAAVSGLLGTLGLLLLRQHWREKAAEKAAAVAAESALQNTTQSATTQSAAPSATGEAPVP